MLGNSVPLVIHLTGVQGYPHAFQVHDVNSKQPNRIYSSHFRLWPNRCRDIRRVSTKSVEEENSGPGQL